MPIAENQVRSMLYTYYPEIAKMSARTHRHVPEMVGDFHEEFLDKVKSDAAKERWRRDTRNARRQRKDIQMPPG